MYQLPIELQRIIYSYDPTYRYKYNSVIRILRISGFQSWTYRSYFYYYKYYANNNIMPSKIKGYYKFCHD